LSYTRVALANAIARMKPSTAAPVDQRQPAGLPSDSHDEPGRHRRNPDRPRLVARIDLCGAMARLID